MAVTTASCCCGNNEASPFRIPYKGTKGGVFLQIIVLMGGTSSERAVSLLSGERVAQALSQRGHLVERVDLTALPDAPLLARLWAADAVFLALHGGEGEDGTLQAHLECAGILHYTGSAPSASRAAMDKACAKRIVARAGVPVAQGGVWERGAPPPPICPPLVLKPLCGGSSVGLQILKEGERLPALPPNEPLLYEQFLPGREFSVGVLGDAVLPAVEICPQGGTYDYAHKYTPGSTRELCPAPISPAYEAQLRLLARQAFLALGLRDYGRIDFREAAAERPVFLEANTLPGMTQTSLLPLAAGAAGISYGALCEKMAALAAARHT